ncbi:MAG: hypothetical protein AAB573_05300 [Patescibacteria group bacterium]
MGDYKQAELAGKALAQVWFENRRKAIKSKKRRLHPEARGIIRGTRLLPPVASMKDDKKYMDGWSIGTNFVRLLQGRVKMDKMLIVYLQGWHFRQNHKR